MLRAGPFSDEDVSALLNRRFVSFYFDLDTGGAAGDAAARKAVVAVRPNLRGMTVVPPPVLLMSPDASRVLGEINNFASEADVLAGLLEALERHPEYAKPADGEDAGTPIQRAVVLAELQRTDEALKLLEGVEDDAATLLRARLLRKSGKAARARKLLDRISDPELAIAVRMERASVAWQAGEFEDLEKLLAEFPADHARATEAAYYRGLAQYHLGDIEDAKATWKRLIAEFEHDRWAYRADWAFFEASQADDGFVTLSSSGSKTLLGRIGYAGRQNPDLARR